jgi:ElaB/YqjD/DUF883 family membrane-anchored ribosome-binding protein
VNQISPAALSPASSFAFTKQLCLHKEWIMAQSTQHSGRTGSQSTDIKEKATDQFERMADKATDQFNRFADQAEGVASRVAEQGREAGEKVQEVAGNLKGAVDKSVKDQPMATLAVAAALGFVLGALWKS